MVASEGFTCFVVLSASSWLRAFWCFRADWRGGSKLRQNKSSDLAETSQF
jgi:hypothetical protein